MKSVMSAKSTMASNLRSSSALRHAEDGAVEEDVLAAGQLAVEAGADLEQRADAAVDPGRARGRLDDARQQLQKRALAGAVQADDADVLAAADLERRVPQRPELVLAMAVSSGRRSSEPNPSARRSRRLLCRWAVPSRVPLAEALDLDGGIGSHMTSAKDRSIRLK